MSTSNNLEELARLVRYYILLSTTEAGSGHPSSSLSAVELTVGLLFGGMFSYDLDNRDNPNNDRFILSKGHAAPLLYALYAAAGKVSEDELKKLRKFGSRLEGHPTIAFPYTEAATGSLGQGLSVGVGMALSAKYVDNLPFKTYVLMGDSEMSEGSIWEAIQIAAYYELNNLIGIIDVNRLGQRGETMYGHNLAAYEKRIGAFGWDTFAIDGHCVPEIIKSYHKAISAKRPAMIIAKTLKGKGVALMEDKNGWHGKPLSRDQYRIALGELGEVDSTVRGIIPLPSDANPQRQVPIRETVVMTYTPGESVSTRRAYGNALVRIFSQFPNMVVLDAEVCNSTYSQLFRDTYPERFFEMFIGEQNMVGVALGLSRLHKIPFASTFAAFFTRAFDQIRMLEYSGANIKFAGSHSGVSIGEDGPSQMGLSDIALFRTLKDCVVLYPADAVSTEKLVEEAALHQGNVYLRLTRNETPVIYGKNERFAIGGSKVLRESPNDVATVIAAGITVHGALAAYEELKTQGISIRVIDLYSIKPIDRQTVTTAAKATGIIISVEDHCVEGGIGEAVLSALAEEPIPVHVLAVRKTPKSGKSGELLDYEDISQSSIVKQVKQALSQSSL